MTCELIQDAAAGSPTNRPRVVWIQNTPDHYFVQMMDSLNAKGDIEYFAVFLTPPPSGNVLYQVPTIAPYKFLGDPNAPVERRRLGPSAREFFAGLDASGVIVGGYDTPFKRWVLRYCRTHGIPAAMFADSNIRGERGRSIKKRLKRFAKRLFLHWVIRHVDVVMPCNRSGVAYWRYYGCPREKIARSTYFCAVDAATAEAVDRKELFNRHGLAPDSRLIFTAARLVPAKALHLMVQAFTNSGLPEKGWVWAVAGGGPLQSELESQAGKYNGNSIRFLGPVKPADVSALMAQCELFVLPSIYEPHGIVVMESMAVGTPVIASDCCGAARDLVKQGITGWMFKSGDAADLQRVLLAACGTPEAVQRVSGACRANFEKWYARYGPLRVTPTVAANLIHSGSAARPG
jgi:glycosyltransferase involved in cell wall biosynthesis